MYSQLTENDHADPSHVSSAKYTNKTKEWEKDSEEQVILIIYWSHHDFINWVAIAS